MLPNEDKRRNRYEHLRDRSQPRRRPGTCNGKSSASEPPEFGCHVAELDRGRRACPGDLDVQKSAYRPEAGDHFRIAGSGRIPLDDNFGRHSAGYLRDHVSFLGRRGAVSRALYDLHGVELGQEDRDFNAAGRKSQSGDYSQPRSSAASSEGRRSRPRGFQCRCLVAH